MRRAANSRLHWRLPSRRVWLGIIVSFVALPSIAAADPDLVLANGLRVVVQEDHRTPDAVLQVWYRVGSLDEENGKTGLSHLVEHLMFTGTAALPDDSFAREIAAAGGRVNAFTGYHYTAYSVQLPAIRIASALSLEADRMRNLLISPAQFATAKDAVRAERKWRIDESIQALAREKLMAAAFAGTPFAHPVIGWQSDIDLIAIDDARAWYSRWYTPDGAVLVVTGDVSSSGIIDEARRIFGGIPAGNMARSGAPVFPEFHSDRISVSGQSAYVVMVYPVPGIDKATPTLRHTMKVIARLLDETDRADADGRVVMSVHAWSDLDRPGAGIFVIDGTAEPPAVAADVEKEIMRRVEMLKREAIPARLLERIEAELVADEQRSQSLFARARRIGLEATAGLPLRKADGDTARSAEELNAAIREATMRYLLENRRAVAISDRM